MTTGMSRVDSRRLSSARTSYPSPSSNARSRSTAAGRSGLPRRRRDGKGEGRAVARGARDADRAPVELDEPLRDREPEPRPLVALDQHVLALNERLEEIGEQRLVHARALILDPKLE